MFQLLKNKVRTHFHIDSGRILKLFGLRILQIVRILFLLPFIAMLCTAFVLASTTIKTHSGFVVIPAFVLVTGKILIMYPWLWVICLSGTIVTSVLLKYINKKGYVDYSECVCGHRSLTKNDNYCSKCGREVKWIT